MCFWKNLANFVGMKNSIDFLPERKQRDLHELAALIRDEVKDVVMIILYGSYAANTYVERDERRDYGVRTIYMSDYDLLVVTKRRLGERESTVEARVRERFAAGKNDENLPRPQIINESISKLNDALTMGRYFYVEIVEKGIMLYDSGECLLTTPKELDYAEIKAMAEEYYTSKYIRATYFFDDSRDQGVILSLPNLGHIPQLRIVQGVGTATTYLLLQGNTSTCDTPDGWTPL